jgi:hypothetical protein
MYVHTIRDREGRGWRVHFALGLSTDDASTVGKAKRHADETRERSCL